MELALHRDARQSLGLYLGRCPCQRTFDRNAFAEFMGSTMSHSIRRHVLELLGADRATADELLAYNENLFDHTQLDSGTHFSLPDEPYVAAWRRYADQCTEHDQYAHA